MPEPQQSSWADDIEEGDISSLPAPSEKYIGDSEKIVTTWSFNEDGKRVKKVSTYKIEKKVVSKVHRESAIMDCILHENGFFTQYGLSGIPI